MSSEMQLFFLILFVGLSFYFINRKAKDFKLLWSDDEFKVYELSRQLTYKEMIAYFKVDLEKLCVVPAARQDFCQKYRDKLKPSGHRVFFIQKSDNKESASLDNLVMIHFVPETDRTYVRFYDDPYYDKWTADAFDTLVLPK